MTIFPAAIVVLLLWALFSLRDADRGISVAIAVLPFGMFAALEANGLSVLAAHLLAALTLGVFCLRWIIGRVGGVRVTPAGLWICAFALYALFSATVLVRLFAGEFLVFPMTVDQLGISVSIFFPSTMKPLAPNNSNIAQAGYILLSSLFFLYMCHVLLKRGPHLVMAGMIWAAGLNIALGVMDMIGLDTVLAVIRTADYTLNNEQTILGIPRVIGGFAEAAAFGPVAATLFGFFSMAYMLERRTRDAALATGNGMLAVLSFSTTAFAALFVAVLLLVLHTRHVFGSGVTRTFGHLLVAGLALIVFVAGVAVLTTPLMDLVDGLITDLFVEKSQSASGLERGAWARAAFSACVETWGLGAGAGSLRGSGFASVVLGSVGLPGALMFMVFLWAALGPIPSAGLPIHQLTMLFAARVAALTCLSAMMVSATTPDPTLFLIVTLAISAVSRQVGRNVRTIKYPNRPLVTGD